MCRDLFCVCVCVCVCVDGCVWMDGRYRCCLRLEQRREKERQTSTPNINEEDAAGYGTGPTRGEKASEQHHLIRPSYSIYLP
jgi:hypothetical protein